MQFLVIIYNVFHITPICFVSVFAPYCLEVLGSIASALAMSHSTSRVQKRRDEEASGTSESTYLPRCATAMVRKTSHGRVAR